MKLKFASSTFLFLAALLPSTRAAAQPADAKASAESLFERGRALVHEGKFAEACPKLAASVQLDPGIGAMLWLADCYEHTERPASAWVMFRDAAALAERDKDGREKVARRRAAALEPSLPRLVVVVANDARATGLDVQRDGTPVVSGEFGVPLPIDPGVHTVTASAPGRTRWSTTIEIPARPVAISVNVPTLEAQATAAFPVSEPRAENRTARAAPTIGLVLLGVGVAAAGTGVALGLTAKSTYDDSNDDGHCRADRCDAVGKEKRSTAFDLATGSTIAFAAGAGALAVGTVLLAIAPRAHRAAMVTPALGPGHAGVVVGRTF